MPTELEAADEDDEHRTEAGVEIDDDNGHGSDVMTGAEDIEQESDESESEGSAGDAVEDEDVDNEGDGDDGTASEVSAKMPD